MLNGPASRPPTPTIDRDLNDAEFEELEGLLAATPEPLQPLDAVMLDGYLCGVLVQPVLIDIDAWLPPIFDFDARPLPDGVPSERTRTLIERRFTAINRALAEDGWFDPLILELDAASLASESAAAKRAEIGIDAISEPLLPWVAGFHHATNHFTALNEITDDDVATAIARLYRHLPAESDDERAVVAMMQRERPLETLDDAIDELVSAVADLYDLTAKQRYQVKTVKHETPKQGRNDPCACGSGKKFKQCHGANAPTA